MPRYELLSIELPKSAVLRAASIDSPTPGFHKGYALDLGGWVLAADVPIVEVHLFEGERFVRSLPFNVERPDVAASFGGPKLVGFSAGILLPGHSRRTSFELRAILRDGRSEPFARLEIRHTGLRSSFQAALQPLLVTSLGRTGTTFTMHILAGHPEIAVHRAYPYETRAGAYWMQVLKVLGESANLQESSHPDGFMSTPFFIGHNPFGSPPYADRSELREWLGCEMVERLAAFAQMAVEEHYRRIIPEGPGPRRRYFAEKCLPNHVPRLFRELYPEAREIFLLRDFRDMICSILAFNRRRGTEGFGCSEASGLDELIRNKRGEILDLLEAVRERGATALILRYEELIREPESEIRRVLDFAGLESSTTTVQRLLAEATSESPELEGHRTTGGARASVGRFREELPQHVQDLCEESFGDLLREVGYAAA